MLCCVITNEDHRVSATLQTRKYIYIIQLDTPAMEIMKEKFLPVSLFTKVLVTHDLGHLAKVNGSQVGVGALLVADLQ